MKKVLITGSQGFIGSYLCNELLKNGYYVVGIDNFSKYGLITRPHDKHPNFTLIYGDAKDLSQFMEEYFESTGKQFEFDYIIALAAKIGGISYFHKYAFDLFKENEDILSSTFEFALQQFKNNHLKRIIVISSSMVFESTEIYPTPEQEVLSCKPPFSAYGRQKLVSEWWAAAAWDQYQLPFSIVRPFNCVGIGEEKALGADEVSSGNIKLMLSHVLPDLVNKILKGQDPVHILGDGNQIRHYTNGADIAMGIRMIMESDASINQDFNISTSEGISVLGLAEKVWNKINPGKKFNYVCDEPYEHDVQKRIPDVNKAKDILGFEANISLDESIEEVLQYMREKND